MKFAYISAVALLALSSCSKKKLESVIAAAPVAEQKTTDTVDATSDFDGKSPEEILVIKYDKITLKCELRTQYGSSLDLDRSANDSFEVDFLNDVKLEKSVMSLKGNANGRDFVVDLKLNQFKVSNVNYTNVKGDTITAQNSPILHLQYKFVSEKVALSGSGGLVGPMKGSSTGDVVYENSSTDLINHSLQVQNENNKYFDNVNCSLTSVSKEKYKDQFKFEPKAN